MSARVLPTLPLEASLVTGEVHAEPFLRDPEGTAVSVRVLLTLPLEASLVTGEVHAEPFLRDLEASP
ncbi:hypothetical protein D7W79_18210 [Corallococcus exercitus]|uniref:hypothetical protein n=1 Tax=Corallococcus exercitus TaxID=2316736 RepID=UPI000EA3A26E|nr:hypothetical protein [Corallococcus exercitus]RKG76252.1 hypothetical protein D7W79_18210 [Corallococcus exercitus]